MLHVSHHAVLRFIKYWRRGTDVAEARQMLEALVARSAATKRKTLPGDAWVHVGVTDRGETVHFAVRDHVVVTVFRRTAYETGHLRLVRAEAPVDREAVEADRARLAERVETECAQRNAEAIVAAWSAGQQVRPRALRRAREVIARTSDVAIQSNRKRAA